MTWIDGVMYVLLFLFLSLGGFVLYLLIGLVIFDLIQEDDAITDMMYLEDDDNIITCLFLWPSMVVEYFKIKFRRKK